MGLADPSSDVDVQDHQMATVITQCAHPSGVSVSGASHHAQERVHRSGCMPHTAIGFPVVPQHVEMGSQRCFELGAVIGIKS